MRVLREHNPNAVTRHRAKLKPCLKTNSLRKNTTVSYAGDTNFDKKPAPVCKSDVALQRVDGMGLPESDAQQARNEIMQKSPMFPNQTSPRTSTTDGYQPQTQFSPAFHTLELSPDKQVVQQFMRRGTRTRYIEDLEKRVAELEHDKHTLRKHYDGMVEQLQYEHDIRKWAEYKAEDLGLSFRIERAKLKSQNAQMELFMQKMATKELRVQNPDDEGYKKIQVSGLDSDDSFDSVSSLDK